MSGVSLDVRAALPRHVTAFHDRHGKMRYRFRRNGFDAYFQNEPGSAAFGVEYQQFLTSEKPSKEQERLPVISLVRQLGATDLRSEYVYFVEAENGLVKIGHTKNIRERFKKLHTGASSQLTLLGLLPGDRDLEQRLHQIFAGQRVTGEWFLSSPELHEIARSKRAGIV